MSRFKLICVDMFQTLVDIYPRRFEAGRRILGRHYTPELAQQCWDEVTKLIVGYFRQKPVENSAFHNVKYVFETCYRQLWLEKGFDINPFMSAKILAEEHGNATIYDDAKKFVDAAEGSYPICLVSDADCDMIDPLLQHFKFDDVFISEEHRSYKIQAQMFREVVMKYRLKPYEILHIGDSYPDVAGASEAGLKTCWINRHGLTWIHQVKPDFTVTGFDELNGII
jgi:HAD superfamily hydrolase (TIGR01549 family)